MWFFVVVVFVAVITSLLDASHTADVFIYRKKRCNVWTVNLKWSQLMVKNVRRHYASPAYGRILLKKFWYQWVVQFFFFFYTFHYVCMHIASSVRVFYASCKVIEWHCIWCLCILVWTWRQKWRAHRLPRDREWWCVRSIQRGWFKGIFHVALIYHNTI